jgi:hypothetical protein
MMEKINTFIIWPVSNAIEILLWFWRVFVTSNLNFTPLDKGLENKISKSFNMYDDKSTQTWNTKKYMTMQFHFWGPYLRLEAWTKVFLIMFTFPTNVANSLNVIKARTYKILVKNQF